MKLRFIEYRDDIYVVVGITYLNDYCEPMCFEAIPLQDYSNFFQAVVAINTFKIPFSEAIEITDKNRILALMTLYGY